MSGNVLIPGESHGIGSHDEKDGSCILFFDLWLSVDSLLCTLVQKYTNVFLPNDPRRGSALASASALEFGHLNVGADLRTATGISVESQSRPGCPLPHSKLTLCRWMLSLTTTREFHVLTFENVQTPGSPEGINLNSHGWIDGTTVPEWNPWLGRKLIPTPKGLNTFRNRRFSPFRNVINNVVGLQDGILLHNSKQPDGALPHVK